MSASATFTRTWPVGRYTATLSLPADPAGPLALDVSWQPRVPKRLTAAELAAYRAGRNEALQAWAAASGRPVAVVDL